MRMREITVVLFFLSILVACGESSNESASTEAAGSVADDSGLRIKTLAKGYGRIAEPGDFVTVHYTGWLYDETADNNRGEKFDSSVDRGEKFQFPLGAGRVIRGWDEGVAGMLIGEKRELTIPADMAYGDRGAGGVIPPGATLVFEVELFAAEPPGASE